MKLDSITKKIFLLTFGILLVFIMIFTALIYVAFPILYENILSNKIITENNKIVETLETENLTGVELENYLQQQTNESGVDIYIYALDEENEYNQIFNSKPIFTEQPLDLQAQSDNSYFSEPIEYNDSTYIVKTSFSKNEIENLKAVMTYLIPYSFIIITVISIFLSIIYSLYITKPIVRLSMKSKRFALLDFEIDNSRYSNDEIGQLNRDLDQMGIHLKVAINKLNNDVEVANKLEFERRNQLAIMSHELKTPLTIIKGQIEMMIANIGKYKDRDFYLNESLKKVEKMQQLVSDILLTSDIESMDSLKNATKYDIQSQIKNIIKEVDQLENNIDIKFMHDENTDVIDANKNIFDQIIKNLIENAIKYTEEDKDVVISFKEHILKIQNYNTKVSDEDLQKLFEPFVRFEKSRNSNKGGHGLGLYIVKKGLDVHHFDYSFYVKDDYVTFEIDFKNNKDKEA